MPFICSGMKETLKTPKSSCLSLLFNNQGMSKCRGNLELLLLPENSKSKHKRSQCEWVISDIVMTECWVKAENASSSMSPRYLLASLWSWSSLGRITESTNILPCTGPILTVKNDGAQKVKKPWYKRKNTKLETQLNNLKTT